jgi:hypothetical protein
MRYLLKQIYWISSGIMVQNTEIDLLFPSRAIEPLRKLRGDRWEDLINHMVDREPADLRE